MTGLSCFECLCEASCLVLGGFAPHAHRRADACIAGGRIRLVSQFDCYYCASSTMQRLYLLSITNA